MINYNSVTYIAGYVCQKLFNRHNCNSCKAILVSEAEFEKNIDQFIHEQQIMKNLITILQNINVNDLYVCDGVIDKIINIFAKMRKYC